MDEIGTTKDALVLVGRATGDSRPVLETHAERLREREVAGSVHVVEYDRTPATDLSTAVEDVAAETAYVVPMAVDRTHVPTEPIREALADSVATVHVCDPVGESTAVTNVLQERAREYADEPATTTLLLVGLGRSAEADAELPGEFHAARLRETADYDQVLTAYLLQSPAVECVRYEARNDDVVAVPLFVASDEATDQRIPDLLDDDVDCTDPLGTHPALTDAVAAELARGRVLTTGDARVTDREATAPVVGDGNVDRRRS
jgi:sirohydrochlorin ferrochelatase